jgi:hypothetical protein
LHLDPSVVAAHRQIDTWSCIPMAIEFVLKLLGRMPASSTDLQTAWRNRPDGSFKNFDGQLIRGVRFSQQFALPRDPGFPLALLFATISKELDASRYVLIALPEGAKFHNYVIYDSAPHGEFLAITKARPNEQIGDVRAQVQAIQGTDIMTYTIEASA